MQTRFPLLIEKPPFLFVVELKLFNHICFSGNEFKNLNEKLNQFQCKATTRRWRNENFMEILIKYYFNGEIKLLKKSSARWRGPPEEY